MRFPTIAATCARYGLDIARDPIPVSPAAHYMIGGVRTDLDGATTVPGLYACGEVAHSGVHGANRLASNSLLESLVFSQRAVQARTRLGGGIATGSSRAGDPGLEPARIHARSLVMDGTRCATRSGPARAWFETKPGYAQRLASARQSPQRQREPPSLSTMQLHAAASTASLVCAAALAREESRGCHLRSDLPQASDQWHGDLVMHKDRGARFDRHL